MPALINVCREGREAVSEPVAVVVPKELYYHEVGYVHGLEARVVELKAALKPFAEESLWAGPQHEFVTVRLSDCDIARAVLKDAPQ